MGVRVKELLPIGSVVRLRGASKCLMVFGVRQTDMQSNVEYDYIGVVYPEGNIGNESQLFFNHEAIEEVLFKGYEDKERDEFIDKLDKFYADQN